MYYRCYRDRQLLFFNLFQYYFMVIILLYHTILTLIVKVVFLTAVIRGDVCCKLGLHNFLLLSLFLSRGLVARRWLGINSMFLFNFVLFDLGHILKKQSFPSFRVISVESLLILSKMCSDLLNINTWFPTNRLFFYFFEYLLSVSLGVHISV